MVPGKKIAIPGTLTSAFLALQLYLRTPSYVVVPFDEIFATVRVARRTLA